MPKAAVEPIFALCAADVVSGGPEALHQLVHLLRSMGHDARVVYVPFGGDHRIPEPYRCYDIRVGTLGEIASDSAVIVPEVNVWKLLRLPSPCKIFFWWLSVDNFEAYVGRNRAGRFLPETLLKRAALALVRFRATANLFQSEYARLYGVTHRLQPLIPLSDYLSAPYIAAARTPHEPNRENLIVYNPMKGADRTQLVLEALAKTSPVPIETVPIRGLSRTQVTGVLSRAKLYIDFGDHPGKDRLPREAAALGCCVLVNRRGSAGNDYDIPIPAQYKVDDVKVGFETGAAEMIVDICANFSGHSAHFESYREMIATEPEAFAAQVEGIFGARPDGVTRSPAASVSGN